MILRWQECLELSETPEATILWKMRSGTEKAVRAKL